MDDSTAARRNAPHIQRVKTLANKILAVNKLVKAKKFKEVAQESATISSEIRGLYSNRELALACTKLDEVNIWCEVKNADQIDAKLVESYGWCEAYIQTLMTD